MEGQECVHVYLHPFMCLHVTDGDDYIASYTVCMHLLGFFCIEMST